MKLKNITITEMYAEDDKIFRNKRTGLVVGKKVRFPFDYFKLGFGASEPATDHPDNYEEIDEYEGWENGLEGNLSRLKGDIEKMNQNKKEINTLGLSGVEALEVKELFPVWGKDIKEGDMLHSDPENPFRFLYTDKDGNTDLYRVMQDHTVLAHYYPSENTLALYRKETEQEGTKEDPIAYELGMMAWEGQYYQEGNVVYLCIRDYDGSTAHMPSVLPGFFKIEIEDVGTENVPVEPEIPEEPVEPDTPVEPETPVEPDTPVEPEQPVEPEEPVVPDVPDTPEDSGETEHPAAEQGSLENPVVWDGSGLLLNGKYYKDGDVIYLCNRDSGNEVTYPLSALVGLYVEVV